jgi:hypothetical protein
MRPLGARSGLGELALRTGRGGRARPGTARAMLREMDMRFWLEKAERLRAD